MTRASIFLAILLVAAGCGENRATGFDAGTPLATTTTTAPATSTTTSTVATSMPAETAESVTLVGKTLPRFGDGTDTAIGLTAPTVSGTNFAGEAVEIGASETFQVVMFLAHWCPHCREEVETLGPYLQASPPPSNVQVLSVSTGVDADRPNYPPSKWLNAEDWPVPVLVDTADGAVGAAFGLNAYPFWVVLDPNGVVLARTAGSLPLESVETLFDNLAELEG